jgi:hypothetical protein
MVNPLGCETAPDHMTSWAWKSPAIEGGLLAAKGFCDSAQGGLGKRFLMPKGQTD